MSLFRFNGYVIVSAEGMLADRTGVMPEALPTLLRRLKTGGYKVVVMKAKAPVQTIASYDEGIAKDAKLPTVSIRPVNSVVQTISE